MDFESQDRVKSLVERTGPKEMVVVLGAADAEALRAAAETVTRGDPSLAGPLAGTALGLPVLHILEEEVKRQIDPALYQRQLGLLELTLDAEAIRSCMREIRSNGSIGS
jgi:hypothetical protein